MAILGGSPLGLINVRSNATLSGMSTFNNGNSRNIKVISYNKGNPDAALRGNSLFTGDRIVRAWPGIQVFNDRLPGNKEDINAFRQRKTLHNNDVYDISLLNIIEHLAGTAGSLKMADFAYLRDIGVYPNNRLLIARRFGGPVGDNIVLPKKKGASGDYDPIGAMATLISWLPQDSDYLNISFGEKWTDAEADFKDLLNRIGGDVQTKGSSKAGGMMESVGNAIPLPGFTEGFQRQFLSRIGILDEDSADKIPSGNPNLIKEAKRRTTIGYESAGSGLSCTVEIEMNCEYELKFISGIDPTIVWMDIIGTILRFGTSPSDTYGLAPTLTAKVDGWLKNPGKLVNDVVNNIVDGLKDVANSIDDHVAAWSKKSYDAIKAAKAAVEADANDAEKKAIEFAKSAVYDFKNFVFKFIVGAVKTLAKKYRVEIMGIMNALSGLPSTPWHITIGNPLRPVFCAGDMYTSNVKMTLGPSLAFNDLPSSIKVNFTLTNARPWGLQEIISKFNSGYLRTVDVTKTFYETKGGEAIGQFSFENFGLAGGTPSNNQIIGSGSTTNLPTGGTPSNAQITDPTVKDTLLNNVNSTDANSQTPSGLAASTANASDVAKNDSQSESNVKLLDEVKVVAKKKGSSTKAKEGKLEKTKEKPESKKDKIKKLKRTLISTDKDSDGSTINQFKDEQGNYIFQTKTKGGKFSEKIILKSGEELT